MNGVQLISPAKINLFLRVFPKRPDGFHELASLFQAIDLHDTLTLSLADSDQLTCSDADIPSDGRNLVIKAAKAFRRATGQTRGIKCHIEKRIPTEAGLGGGSSNAASLLWGFNELTGTPLSPKSLIEVATDIGSDVPFFLSTGTAYCTGRGEKLLPLSTPKQSQPLWIIKPFCGLSTPKVYSAYKPTESPERDPELALKKCQEDFLYCFNDLERPAFTLCSDLAACYKSLCTQGYTTVRLCGSGTALFCVGARRPQVENCRIYSTRFLGRTSATWYTL